MSWLILVGMWILLVPAIGWALIFAFQFLTLDVSDCYPYGVDWSWFGPECNT